MSSTFHLPVRRVGASAQAANKQQATELGLPTNTPPKQHHHNSQDPSGYSILGEPLPLSHTHDLGPPLGISVASVVAAAAMKSTANAAAAVGGGASLLDGESEFVNTANKQTFQLPVRRVPDMSIRTDSSSQWQSIK